MKRLIILVIVLVLLISLNLNTFSEFKPIQTLSDYVFQGLSDMVNKLISANRDYNIESDINSKYLKNEVVTTQKTYLDQCKIMKPRDFDPKKEYILIVGLHGVGGNAESFSKLWSTFNHKSIIYAVPEAPYKIIKEKGKGIGYSWWDNNCDTESEVSKSRMYSEKYIVDLIKEIKRKYIIKAVYLFGFSQGASMTYGIGLKNQELLTGFISWGAFLPEDWIGSKNLKPKSSMRILIVHGKNDKRVRYKESVSSYKILKGNGFNVEFIDYNGGHKVTKPELQKVKQWILK